MTLPASGQITFDQINIELGKSTGAEASMDTMTAAAIGNSTITNEPDNTADWYGYTHETIPSAPTKAATTYNSTLCFMSTVWFDNSDNETGFRVERSFNGGAFAFLVNKPAGSTGHTDATINSSSSSNQYQYRIRAYNGAGDSAWATAAIKNTSPICIPV